MIKYFNCQALKLIFSTSLKGIHSKISKENLKWFDFASAFI